MTSLTRHLANLYPDRADIARILSDTGVDSSLMDLDDSPINNWHVIISSLSAINGKMPELISLALSEYPSKDLVRKYLEWSSREEYDVKIEESNASKNLYEIRRDLDRLSVQRDFDHKETEGRLRIQEEKIDILDQKVDQISRNVDSLISSKYDELRSSKILIYSIVFAGFISVIIYVIANYA